MAPQGSCVKRANNNGADAALAGNLLPLYSGDPAAAVVAASFVLLADGRLDAVSSDLRDLLASSSSSSSFSSSSSSSSFCNAADSSVLALGRLTDLLASPRDAVLLMEWLAQVHATRLLAWPTHIRCFDGRVLAVELIATGLSINGAAQACCAVRSLDGSVCGTDCDIGERKRVEHQLRIAAVAFESPISMMITDQHQVIQRVNHAFVERTGFSAEYAVGKTPRFLRSGTHEDSFYADMWRTIRDTGVWQGELMGLRQNGQRYPKWVTISAVRDDNGEISHYLGTETDMSERKSAEAALRALNQSLDDRKTQLREMLVQLDAARENERKHMAREVHDELGQILTALRMDTSYLAMRYGEGDAGLQAKITGMRLLVDAAIRGVRGVASNLRPVALDMGFHQALEWVCRDFSARTDVPCALQSPDSEVQLNDGRAIVVFRIVQESLTNISRYAHASRVAVRLWLDGNQLWVEIQDNGCGFDPVAVGRFKKFGLLGMHERALSLGGHLEVVSAPGAGTTVGLTIPYNPVGGALA